MTKKDRYESSGLSLMDAVEVLSEISEFDLDQSLEEILSDIPEQQRVIWVKAGGDKGIVSVMRETLYSILQHFRHMYKQHLETDPKSLEGMKTIMVLVGETAKKVDKYTRFFQEVKEKSVSDLKEYRDLQEFYLKKMARKIDEGMLGKWILGLAQRAFEQKGLPHTDEKNESEAKHVFVDLESVKNDSEYELFFMRKEDGTRFFSPRLLRNVKLVCDFGDYFGEKRTDRDPFIIIPEWRDRVAFTDAKNILESVSSLVHQFYHEALPYNDRDLVGALNKAIMALILCTDPKHMTKDHPVKSCQAFFLDFQVYLREALFTHDYHKMLAYPPKKEQKVSRLLLNLSQRLCEAFYTQLRGFEEINSAVQGVLMEAHDMQSEEHTIVAKDSHTIWNQLAGDYAAMARLVKQHAQGPLVKILNALEEGGYQMFDPLMQHNIPNHLFDLYIHERKMSLLRMASPTEQEFIHKAKIADEFKEYLRLLAKDPGRKHLLINLQDSTSWREHARSVVLEDLQKQDEFIDVITVVTLSTDSDFYHQDGVYADLNHSVEFIEQFKEHLEGVGFGYYFPMELKRDLFPSFVNGVTSAIHRIFFSGRNVLSRDDRLNFIQIFYLFLQLKLIELVEPENCSIICKDGVDSGQLYSTFIYAFMKLLNGEKVNQRDIDFMSLMIYGPALLIRERLPLIDRFNRMLNGLKTIELVREDIGYKNFITIVNDAFGFYYKTDIFQSFERK